MPSGTSSLDPGSTTRTRVPGSGLPTDPRMLGPVVMERQARTGDVSVRPHPFSTGMPMACGRRGGGAGSEVQAGRHRVQLAGAPVCSLRPHQAPQAAVAPASCRTS